MQNFLFFNYSLKFLKATIKANFHGNKAFITFTDCYLPYKEKVQQMNQKQWSMSSCYQEMNVIQTESYKKVLLSFERELRRQQ